VKGSGCVPFILLDTAEPEGAVGSGTVPALKLAGTVPLVRGYGVEVAGCPKEAVTGTVVLLAPLDDAVLPAVASVTLPLEKVNGAGAVPDGASDMDGRGEVKGPVLSEVLDDTGPGVIGWDVDSVPLPGLEAKELELPSGNGAVAEPLGKGVGMVSEATLVKPGDVVAGAE